MSKKNNKPENFMDYVPRHNVNYPYDIDEKQIVTVHVKWRGPFHWIATHIFRKPDTSHIKLDETGSYIWKLIDGEKTVQEIYEQFERDFPDMEDSLKRVVQFLKILRNNEFIVYNVPLKEDSSEEEE